MNIKRFSIFAGLLLAGIGIFSFFLGERETTYDATASLSREAEAVSPKASLPVSKVLPTDYHIYQTFNNCAPAALSMALSYYGIEASQEALAKDLRPFNNPQGKNDDKSTPPEELALKAREYGLIPYYRGGGDIEILKQFIAADLPIVVRTLLYADKDFAHYRVIKGYDSARKEIIQDDSLNGKNLRFSYEEFNLLWKPFNRAYLVLVPPEKQKIAEEILRKSADETVSWQKAVDLAEAEVARDSLDMRSWFNLSVARYYTRDYAGSVEAFEKAEKDVPLLYLWYQVEPIRSYLALGNYDRVFALSNDILKPDHLAFSELYMLRGESYLRLGDREEAKAEFEKALHYNVNYKPAKEALAALDLES